MACLASATTAASQQQQPPPKNQMTAPTTSSNRSEQRLSGHPLQHKKSKMACGGGSSNMASSSDATELQDRGAARSGKQAPIVRSFIKNLLVPASTRDEDCVQLVTYKGVEYEMEFDYKLYDRRSGKQMGIYDVKSKQFSLFTE